MAGFDVPHVTNDMMLRFMGVDFTLVPGIAAGSESKVGKVDRVHLGIAGEKPGGVPILKGGNSGTEGEYMLCTCVVSGDIVLMFSGVQCRLGIPHPYYPHLHRRLLLLLPPHQG